MSSIHHAETPVPSTAELAHGLERFESDLGCGRVVSIPVLGKGTVLTLHTRNHCYRMLVRDAAARRVLITGGRLFPQSTEVRVVGARSDDGVTPGAIVEGLSLELSTPLGPVLTSMVESVAVDGEAST